MNVFVLKVVQNRLVSSGNVFLVFLQPCCFVSSPHPNIVFVPAMLPRRGNRFFLALPSALVRAPTLSLKEEISRNIGP